MWLRRTEQEVWEMTPKKLNALLKVHKDVQEAKYGDSKKNTGTKQAFIDNIPGW